MKNKTYPAVLVKFCPLDFDCAWLLKCLVVAQKKWFSRSMKPKCEEGEFSFHFDEAKYNINQLNRVLN